MKTKTILGIIAVWVVGILFMVFIVYINELNKLSESQKQKELDSLRNVKMRAIYQNGYVSGVLASQREVFQSLQKSTNNGKLDINTVPSIEQMKKDSIEFETKHIHQ